MLIRLIERWTICFEYFLIQKADKGNTVVILKKKNYNLKKKKILSDSYKFHKLSIDQNKYLIILSIWKIE